MSGDLDMLLHPETWPHDDHLEDVTFIGRALEEIAEHPKFVGQDLGTLALEELVSGRLVAVIILPTGDYLTIPKVVWRVNGRARLLSCAITEHEARGRSAPTFLSALAAIEYMGREARDIYITDDSLELMLGYAAPAMSVDRRRGPKTGKKAGIIAAMELMSDKDLSDMLEKEMPARFGGSRTTCREARNYVMKLRQIASNDK